MRLVFIDLHLTNFLVRTYSQIKSGNMVKTYKHKFILDYAKANGIEVCNYISFKECSIRGARLVADVDAVYKRLVKYEATFVYNKSFAEQLTVKTITNKNYIKKTDIVIAYLYRPVQLEILKQLGGIHVLMGNHFVSINEPLNLAEYDIKAFVNEINLSENAFVRKFIYKGNAIDIICPYIYGDRFKNKWQQRKNKVFAVGTLSTCKGHPDYKLYRKFFKTEWIQPMRKMILDEGKNWPAEIDCFISYIHEDKLVIKETDNILVKFVKRINNRFTGWTQRKYTSFNMVDKFNEYMMFICPEELVGMPGIGFVEGMSCGCAYIGLDTSYYRALGLVPGIHYIVYDGTLENLIEVIRQCQNNKEDVKQIAEKGMQFVRSHFNEIAVAQNLFASFETLTIGEIENEPKSLCT